MPVRKYKPASNVPVAITIVILFIVMAVGGTIVHRANPDATATLASFFGIIIATGVPLVINLVKVRDVEKQTNGRLHAKDDEIAAKDIALIRAGIDPNTLKPFTSEIQVVDDSSQ